MRHPTQRAERRFTRDTWIARRVYIREKIWRTPRWKINNGKLAKWNLNCGCMMCHYGKYFSEKRRRREILHAAVNRNLQEWGEL